MGADWIEKSASGWTFFCLAGSARSDRIWYWRAKDAPLGSRANPGGPESAEFNSLEIMRVASEARNVPGSVLCDCLRTVTAYPGQRVSLQAKVLL